MKKIKGWEGYFVTECGKIYSDKSNIFLKPRKTKKGYEQVTLSSGQNNRKQESVHRAVAEAYLGNPPEGCVVNHIDGNKGNNHYKNLEWCTQSENVKHSYRLGLQDKRGARHHLSRLNEWDVRFIRHWFSVGVSCKEISEIFEVSRQCISSIVFNRNWTHV